MSAPLSAPLGPNHVAARVLIGELQRLGCEAFIIAPGARSAPLVEAVAELDSREPVVHFDERGAAFAALGFAKASGTPAVMITTSGTAVGNLLPACIEACYSAVPIIFLTADRPFEMIGSGANQTIVQDTALSPFVRWKLTIPPPHRETAEDELIQVSRRAFERSTLFPPGPVHLNFQFREPLLTNEQPIVSSRSINQGKCKSVTYPGTPMPSQEALALTKRAIEESSRGLVVVGELSHPRERLAFGKLATLLSWPILCDVASGLRSLTSSFSPEQELRCTHYDLYLDSPTLKQPPDLIIHIGRTPTSKSVLQALKRWQSKVISLANPFTPEQCVSAFTTNLCCSLTSFLAGLSETELSLKKNLLTKSLLSAEQKSKNIVHDTLFKAETSLEWRTLAHAVSNTTETRDLYLGNSLPIRLANILAPLSQGGTVVYTHRGASGIDGTLAQAFGVVRASGRPLTVILGDYSFLHDLNSLALFSSLSTSVVLVVLNNDGGAIFGLVESLKPSKNLEKMFTVPHGFTFSGVASTFGVAHVKTDSLDEFKRLYADAAQAPGVTIVEVVTSGTDTVAQLQSFRRKIHDALIGESLL